MNFFRKTATVLTALAMFAGMGFSDSIQKVYPPGNLTASAAFGDEGILGFFDAFTYLDFDGYGEITACDFSTETVEIPADIEGTPVTRIGDYAFYFCNNMTSVSIPDHVSRIGEYAFCYCEVLTSVTVPERDPGQDAMLNVPMVAGASGIGDYAFSFCNNLTSVTLPESITSIGSFSFYGCNSLNSVTMPDSITSIGEFAFSDCTSLTSVTLPENISSIGMLAFSNCSSLTSVTIPDKNVIISEYAFLGCDNLTDVYYAGSERQWQRMLVTQEGNEALLNANIHFERDIPGISQSPEPIESNESTDSDKKGATVSGDVDESGTVDLLDAILLNKHLMSGTEISEQAIANADVDLDGKVDAVDSLNILKYVVRLIPELPMTE